MIGFSVVTKKAHKIEIEGLPGSAPAELLEQVHESITLINRIYAKVPTLTPEDVIERGLLLAKMEPSDQEIAEAFIYVRMRELRSGDLKKWSVEGIAQRTNVIRDWWVSIKSDRRKFRDRIDELVKDPDQARKMHQHADRRVVQENVLVVPWNDEHGDTRVRHFPMNIESAWKYVLQNLYNEKKKRWEHLRKCKWKPCSEYFWRKERKGSTGGRPREYCSPECQKKPDQERALIRQVQPDQREKQRERRRKYREEGKK